MKCKEGAKMSTKSRIIKAIIYVFLILLALIYLVEGHL